MKKLLSWTVLVFVLSTQLNAQSFTSSNLPIVLITTDGNATIPDEPKILSSMKIIYSGEGIRNYVSDQNNASVLNYDGRIKIEVRGSSSQYLEKKQYGFTTLMSDNITNNNVSLLGMPIEHDWVLNGLAFDASLIRDYISYGLSQKIGNYAPRTQYCEVVINDNYSGLYLLQETIKADDNRVDVRKIGTTDTTLPDLTGGYITKADKVAGGDISAWQMSSYIGLNDVNFIHSLPKPSNVTPEQNNYIHSWFDRLESTSHAGNASVSDGYPSIIDIPSFIDFMIINELSANVDAYQFSTYFHKDKNGKLRAGPLWDLNLTYGNDLLFWNLDRSKTNTWQFNNGDNIGPKFWRDLFDNTTYKCYLSKRWNELTQSGAPLHITTLETFIDQTVNTISEATVREQTRWQSVGDQPSNINMIKSFLASRMDWMNKNIGSFSSCQNVPTPPLVIDQIMYYPSTSTAFPGSSDQEFIEITNTGNEDVNMTGIYFSGTGFVFQFPVNFILPAFGVIQLANNTETFQQLYGFSPFGKFSRNLSNERQKLTLADGYGNVIDKVEYSNQAPWPNVSDNGFHLKLISLDLDNNVGSNWSASNVPPLSNVVATDENDLTDIQLFPNPFDNIIMITSSTIINTLRLHDLEGRILENLQVESNAISLDMNKLSSGMYILTMVTNGKIIMRKVIKK